MGHHTSGTKGTKSWCMGNISNKIFMKPTLVETQRERETSQLIPYSLDSTVTHWPISVSESLMYNK